MSINNYQTGEFIGNSISINDEAYEAELETNPTGAVRAGDWLSDEDLAQLGIDEDLTIYAD